MSMEGKDRRAGDGVVRAKRTRRTLPIIIESTKQKTTLRMMNQAMSFERFQDEAGRRSARYSGPSKERWTRTTTSDSRNSGSIGVESPEQR